MTSTSPLRTLRITGPADLLAAVPVLLGFQPERSAVLLTLGGATDPFVARVDLPTAADAGLVAQDLSGVAARNGVRAVALVLLTSDATVASWVHDAFDTALASWGIDLQVALRADGARWYPLSGLPGASPDGEEYDLRSHPFTLEALLEGREVHAGRHEVAGSLLPVDPDEVVRVGQAAHDAADRMLADCSRATLVAEGRWVRDLVRRHTAGPSHDLTGRLSDDDAGRLLVALQAVEVRDVAWADMNRAAAAAHVRLWRDLARRAPVDLLAPPAALLAFAAWLAGDGALAWCAVERARAGDPDYTLTGLVERALTCAVPPSSWTPLSPENLTLFTR